MSADKYTANSSFFFLGALLECVDVVCMCSIIELDKGVRVVCACTLNCISYLFLYLILTILEV